MKELRPNELRSKYNLAKSFLSVRIRRCVNNPIACEFYVTYGCNLRCMHCNSWRDGSEHEEMSYGEVEEMFRLMRRMGIGSVGYSGGEPLLREDLPSVLRLGQQLGFRQYVTTNGTLMSADLAHVLASTCNAVHVSIDGGNEIHDKIRGSGTFAKATESVKLLKRHGARVGLEVTVSKLNFEELPKLYALARDTGVEIGFQPFNPPGVVFPREGGCVGDLTLEEQDVGKLKRFFEYCTRAPASEYLQGMTDFMRGEKRRKCTVAYLKLTIAPDGLVFPCALWNEPVGHWKELPPLWKSRRFEEIRSKMFRCDKCYLDCYEPLNILHENLQLSLTKTLFSHLQETRASWA